MIGDNDKKTSTKTYIIVIVLLGSLISVCLFAFIPWSTIFPPETPAITEENSSIIMTDWTSKENLGELCPVTVRGDKGQITTIAERYDPTFYEVVSTEIMPADFDKDLSEYDYIMITCNPDEATDGYWATYDYFYPNMGNNFVFNMNAYHEATDLYGNVLNIVGGSAINLTYDATGVEEGNYTIPLWYPTVTKTELHRGKYFAIEDDIADLSQTTLDKLWNERNYRSEPTLYTDADNTCTHGLSGEFEWITETFGIEYIFNDTISTTDAAVTQVNFTAMCDYDFVVDYDDTKLYFITTESWNTINGNFEMFFEIIKGDNITINSIKVGKITIPGRFLGTDYTFTSDETLASV